MKQNLSFLNPSYPAYIFVGLFFSVGIILAFVFNGTCDEGDSIMHYQYAKYAPFHPELFFNHWAKPVFVLFAALPCQFGIEGIKIFNLLMLVLSAVLSFQIAGLLNIRYKSLAAIFTLMMPAAMVYSLSGLTEPMFALVLTLAIGLYLQDKLVLSILILSFLPFVRSEGLMMCGVFGFMMVIERRWWLLPLLGVGHVVYSVAGYFYYHDLLWVFTQIPYARLSSAYGIGTWDHFFVKSLWIVGVPLYFLLGAGIVYLLVHLLRKGFWGEYKREVVLVYGCFLTFFLGHVVFWALGIFNSFGVLRVLVCVLPLMALIQLRGFHFLTDEVLHPQLRFYSQWVLIIYSIVFPFTSNPYAWDIKRDFSLRDDQELQNQLAYDIRQHYPDYQNKIYYFNANHISVALNFDYFNKDISKRIWEGLDKNANPSNAFLIWDDWYAAFEASNPLESVLEDSRYELIKEYIYNGNGFQRKTVLFKTKDFPTNPF